MEPLQLRRSHGLPLRRPRRSKQGLVFREGNERKALSGSVGDEGQGGRGAEEARCFAGEEENFFLDLTATLAVGASHLERLGGLLKVFVGGSKRAEEKPVSFS